MPARSRLHPPRALVLVVVAAALAGCSPASVPGTSSAGSSAVPDGDGLPATAPSSAADVGAVRATGTAITSGPVTLWVLPDARATVGVEPQPDGSARFTALLQAPPADTSPAPEDGAAGTTESDATVHIAAAEGHTFTVHDDLSVVVRDGAGTPVGGLAPLAPSTAGVDARYRAVLPDLLAMDVTVGPGQPAAGVAVPGWLGSAALLSLEWGERAGEGGRSLAVEPTAWARAGGQSAEEVTRAALVAAEPEASSTTMLDQLVCHSTFAPTKATWNLEPWRPEVSGIDMVLAGCNPEPS